MSFLWKILELATRKIQLIRHYVTCLSLISLIDCRRSIQTAFLVTPPVAKFDGRSTCIGYKPDKSGLKTVN